MSAPELQKYALIVAGGKGIRMGSETPKQFIKLSGKPVLMRTIEAFHHYSPDIRIILVLNQDLMEQWNALCGEYRFTAPVELVEGGQERFHSVKNGLGMVEQSSLVAIHDGVRPLVTQRIIADSFTIAAKFGSAVPVSPLNETVRKIKDGKSQVIDRCYLFSVQTPQTFLSDLIQKAYLQDYREDFTDDASLVESMGEKVHFFPGDSRNIKITRQEDMKLAEMMMGG